jgi:hypothetical protein
VVSLRWGRLRLRLRLEELRREDEWEALREVSVAPKGVVRCDTY